MLEDQSIQHLIAWSSTNESFVMSPSTEFSKVLSYVPSCSLHPIGAHVKQDILQTHKYILLRAAIKHVWVSQRYMHQGSEAIVILSHNWQSATSSTPHSPTPLSGSSSTATATSSVAILSASARSSVERPVMPSSTAIPSRPGPRGASPRGLENLGRINRQCHTLWKRD